MTVLTEPRREAPLPPDRARPAQRIGEATAWRRGAVRCRVVPRVRCQPDDRQARDAAAGGGWPGPARTGPRQLRRQTATASADQPADDVQPGDASDGPGAELRVLLRQMRPASSGEAASLGIAAREPIVHLRRLRLADGEPIALESTVLIAASADAVMAADLARGSLHEALGRPGSSSGAARARSSQRRRRPTRRAFSDPDRRPAAGGATGHRRLPRPPDRGDRVTLRQRTGSWSTSTSRSRRGGLRFSARHRLERPLDVVEQADRRGAHHAEERSPNSAVDPRPSPQVPDCVAR